MAGREHLYCSAKLCTNRKNMEPNMSYFRFPKERERCDIWIERSGREDVRHKSLDTINNCHRLCSEHFEDSQFMNAQKRNRLIWNAVPTLFPSIHGGASHAGYREAIDTTASGDNAETYCCLVTLEYPDSPNNENCVMEQDFADLSTLMDTSCFNNQQPTNFANNQVICLPNTHVSNDSPSKTLKDKTSTRKKHKTKNTGIDKVLKLTKKASNLTEPQLAFFESQMRLSNRKIKGKRWNQNDKEFMLSIFYQSPRTYKIFRQVFALPAVKRLNMWASEMTLSSGLLDTMLLALKQKTKNMISKDKICVLTLGDLPLCPSLNYEPNTDSIEGFVDLSHGDRLRCLADRAIVIMVHGLFTFWTQPIGYILSQKWTSSSKLYSLVLESITKLEESGLNIKVLVADQRLNKGGLFAKLGVTESNPFFIHNNKKIFTIYDPPGLLKSLCFNLKKYHFKLNENLIKWDFIDDLYTLDSCESKRYAPKLTRNHVKLKQKMKLKQAAQVMSSTTALAVNIFVAMGKLPAEAAHTAQFLGDMDELFVTMNCSQFKASSKPLRRALTENHGHLSVLNKSIEMLRHLQVICGPETRVHCVSGWLVSIAGIKALWEELQTATKGIKSLATHRLNKDRLENMFSIIRQSSARGTNPSLGQFKNSFKKILIDRLLTSTQSDNCEADLSSILFELSNFSSLSVVGDSSYNTKNISNNTGTPTGGGMCSGRAPKILERSKLRETSGLKTINEQYEDEELNSMRYLTRQVMKKIMVDHNKDCNVCWSIFEIVSADKPVVPHQIGDNDSSIASNDEVFEYSIITSIVPSDVVLEYILQVEKVFLATFNDKMEMLGLRKHILNLVSEIDSSKLCQEYRPVLGHSYVKMRMLQAVRFLNKELKKHEIDSLTRKEKTRRKIRFRIQHLHC